MQGRHSLAEGAPTGPQSSVIWYTELHRTALRVVAALKCAGGLGRHHLTQGLHLQTDGVHAITGLPAADRHYAVV